jgi:hypothetical protein
MKQSMLKSTEIRFVLKQGERLTLLITKFGLVLVEKKETKLGWEKLAWAKEAPNLKPTGKSHLRKTQGNLTGKITHINATKDTK